MHAPQHDHVLQLHDYLFVLFQHFVGNVGIVEFGYIGHREQYIAFDVLQRPTGIQINIPYSLQLFSYSTL